MRVSARTDEALEKLMYNLSQYNFKIILAHEKDSVEALSRNPVLGCYENKDYVLKLINLEVDWKNQQKKVGKKHL